MRDLVKVTSQEICTSCVQFKCCDVVVAGGTALLRPLPLALGREWRLRLGENNFFGTAKLHNIYFSRDKTHRINRFWRHPKGWLKHGQSLESHNLRCCGLRMLRTPRCYPSCEDIRRFVRVPREPMTLRRYGHRSFCWTPMLEKPLCWILKSHPFEIFDYILHVFEISLKILENDQSLGAP